MAHDEEPKLDRLLSDGLAQPVESEKAVLDGLRVRLRNAPPPVAVRSERTWWLHTAAAILLVAAAGLLVWQPWEKAPERRPAAGPSGKDGDGTATDAGKLQKLTLTLEGPFANQKEIPFGKTDCPFVLPGGVEFRESKDAMRLRVRFRFKGPMDFSAGVCVDVKCEEGQAKQQDDRVCADPRFLKRMPLWAGKQEDELTTVAEFEWPAGTLERLTRVEVGFSKAPLFEGAEEPALTDAAWARAIEQINLLEDESFERRRNATTQLVAMGEPLRPFLEMLDVALAEHPDAPGNMQVEIRTVGNAIAARIVERERAKLAASLKDLLTSGRNVYRAPTPKLKRALKNRVSFEMVDRPINKALESVSATSGVMIVLDPEVEKAGPPTINLRVTDMSADLAIGWILRLADLDYALHGGGVVVTTKERARLLNSEERAVSLPVEPGSAPWTEDELKRFCARHEVTDCRLDGPNRAKLVAEHAIIEKLTEELACFEKPQPMPDAALPDWVVAIEKQLDTKINLQGELDFQEALSEIRRQSSVTVILDPKAVEGGALDHSVKFTQKEKDQTARDALKTLVRQAGLHVRIANQSVFVYSEPYYPGGEPVMLPLNEVLKTGVSRDELFACLRRVIEDTPCTQEQSEARDPEKNTVRGRWFLNTDEWTRQRLIQVLDQTIRTRRVPPVPPLPWFTEISRKQK